MPGRPHATQETIDLAVRMVLDHGHTCAEVAREAGVSAPTVERWVRRARKDRAPAPARLVGRAAKVAARVAAGAAEDPPEDPPDDDPAAEGDLLAATRAMQREAMRSAALAKRDGNMTAAQRYFRDAANLTPVIARLEKLGAEDGDAIRITREEIERTKAGLLERIHMMTDRPLLCAQCSRELSIEWARRPEERTDDDE